MDAKGIHVRLVSDAKPVIASFYKMETTSFFRECHKAGGGYCEAVEDTYRSISKDSDVFVVSKGQDDVGFFVRNTTEELMVLEGFHIKKGFRNGEVICDFWNIVRDAFESEMCIGVLHSNTPAINHLKRNGFKQVSTIESDGKSFILLQYKIY